MRHCAAILFVIVFCSPLLVSGQTEQQVTLQGVVVDADSLYPVPFVHIRAVNKNQGTATSSEGQFRIRVNRQDTIVFSSVGYQNYLLVPADSTAESLQQMRIYMTAAVSELDEVTVKAYEDISRYIRREAAPFTMERSRGVPLFEKKEAQPSSGLGLSSGMNGAALEGAVTAFANLFSSRFQQEKKLRKLLEIQEAEERQNYLRQVMTEKYQLLVAEVTGLEESYLLQFTERFMPEPEGMLALSDYDLVVSILGHLPEFESTLQEDSAIEDILHKGVFEGQQKSVE